jgi:hypothetical protein
MIQVALFSMDIYALRANMNAANDALKISLFIYH